MRILQVCAVDFTAYHFLRALMHGCRDRGWDVAFACAPGPWTRMLTRDGFRYHAIPVQRSRSVAAHLRASITLARAIRAFSPSVVHTHTPIGGLVGRLAALATPRVPVAHTFHGLPIEATSTDRMFSMVERVLARRTAFFFSQSSADLERAVLLGIARRKDSLVIGNGVDTERFRPDLAIRLAVREELGLAREAIVIVTVGRLVREKGHLDLLDAVARLNDGRPHLWLVGSALPSDRSSIESELRSHPSTEKLGDRLRVLGHVEDVERILAAADIFVLASYREGLPRSVIEAMAAGLPVVATTIPAHRELVIPELTGLLVPPRDPTALARALDLLVKDVGTRTTMGRRGREEAVHRFREVDVVARQMPVLERLAKG